VQAVKSANCWSLKAAGSCSAVHRGVGKLIQCAVKRCNEVGNVMEDESYACGMGVGAG
jgi:hypothetical protein